ncbi:hypothetical protein BS78_01G325600 [Paspalum vaginatum]|nr:hypothetical protein BS78_01G325600 [Paspalum vaginatum]KAJ1296743.1 hypothetical protein BS78_01G325600 [Paspalum vaginatum]KAJ1296745.1 hypothetical protein BS78_01G325600 [Paspalum vaginatum]
METKNPLLDEKQNHESKKIVYNLSLPKLISVSKLLTPHQRTLAESFSFHHLLDLRCDAFPRGISQWIASNFDVSSKSILLPNGSKFPITAHCVHQVLGIPYGGEKIARKCDDSLKNWVIQLTKCEGSSPTMNELKALINPNLVGDQFKVVFALFTVGSFLCPTSHACISPEYYSAICTPEKIGSFDWCEAVLERIVQSIAFYQKTNGSGSASTTTLGGCILVLVIIYFELLDIPIDCNSDIVPRLKFWTTDMIKSFETLDAFDHGDLAFGRVPMRDLSRTPFWTSQLHSSLVLEPTTRVRKGCPVCSSGEEQFSRHFQAMFEHMQEDIFNAVKPIVSSYADKFHRLWHPSGTTSAQEKGFSVNAAQDVAGNVADESKKTILNLENGNSGLVNVSSTAKDEQPKHVKSDPTSELTMFQITNIDVSGGSNENVSSDKVSSLSPAPTEPVKDSSSVLQVPSYSQDSYNTSETTICFHQAYLCLVSSKSGTLVAIAGPGWTYI